MLNPHLLKIHMEVFIGKSEIPNICFKNLMIGTIQVGDKTILENFQNLLKLGKIAVCYYFLCVCICLEIHLLMG